MLFLLCFVCRSEAITPLEILKKAEETLRFERQELEAELYVETTRRKKEYLLSIYQKDTRAAVEFHSPIRDKGTKYLRKEDALWMYLPSVEKTQRIVGHMLQQGVMGSDISYDELLQSPMWASTYQIEKYEDVLLFGQKTFHITLQNQEKNTLYPRRELWIEQEHYVPIQELVYDSSGTLYKEWNRSHVQKSGEKWMAHQIEVQNKLHTQSKTTILIKKIKENPDLSEDFFLHRWLER